MALSELGQGAVVWYLADIYNGDPARIVEEARALNLQSVWFKFGNGLTKWRGLEKVIDALQTGGLKACGWWYFFGQPGEGTAAGQHAAFLNLDAVCWDIEGHFDRSGGNLTDKAKRLGSEFKSLYDGPTGLCSWWKPSYHPTPVKTLLSFCEFNAPQDYWIGRYTEAGVKKLIYDSLAEYNSLAGWPAEKTLAMFSAYGQKYWDGSKWVYWETTIPQMDAAEQAARAAGMPGLSWYSWNFWLGKSGSPDRQPRPEIMAAIAGYDWAGEIPEPAPEFVNHEIYLKQYADPFLRSLGYSGPKPA